MKRRIVCFTSALFLFAWSVLANDNETRVIYPTTATSMAELDNSTPAKRAEPPVFEPNEIDPVTPIGQIKGIRDSLNNIEQMLDAFGPNSFGDLPTKKDVTSLFPLLEKESAKTDALGANVEEVLTSSRLIGGKIDDLKTTTENLRATVEAAQKTVASIEKIRTSRWTDYAVLAILGLAILQLLGKTGGFFFSGLKRFWQRLENLANADEIAQKLLDASKERREG